ncbi:response regulator receiver modulated serine phosphatase [Solidesulfovibrio fructosivorans JJ]]|uniref:Response regulator receiver modulated serine phosphatase n=1 Tax=Solidesulfovibrio fructosivorans JJ] TaxID=596151 RepID=E1JSV0_SOLFR|nr:SpoIIE family protein phosphatase [Solidesulfovibrio fructosivorans]EFL52583.1 response regulator receiver modulated serine phosphatase [Solidesulfovibrio fructosivorans JJ]]
MIAEIHNPTQSPHPPRVLVVDDSKTMRRLICLALQDAFELEEAVDGVDALERYSGFKPQIILLDMEMPRMGGLEVIRQLRETVEDTDTFIIVLSGLGENDLKAKALNMGANDYLTKPFHPEELKARVSVAGRQVLLNHELRRAYARISAEIALVASLQHQLLPNADIVTEGLEIQSLYRPSGQASGDYYDYFRMADGRIRLVLADIAGKGARAAFLMAIVQAFFRLGRRDNHSLEKTVTLINDHLMEISPSGSDFATLFAGEIDLEKGFLTYLNAGHCPGLLINPNGTAQLLEAQVYPLGMLAIENVKANVIPFAVGARLFLYTDGMFEWELDQSNMLSLGAFLVQAKLAAAAGGDFLDALAGKLTDLTGATPKYLDDQTALWIRRSGPTAAKRT